MCNQWSFRPATEENADQKNVYPEKDRNKEEEEKIQI